MPRKFRDRIPDGRVVVAKGMNGCLAVYPEDRYEEMMARLRQSSPYDPRALALRRFFMSGASTAELDKAGRLNIPPALREHAGLERDVCVSGVGDWIEIWDASKWEAYNAETAESLESSAAELAGEGIL